MNVWRLAWRVSQHEPRSFWIGTVGFVVFFTLPALVGWTLGRAFDALSRSDSATVIRWAVLLLVVEVVRMIAIHIAAITFTQSWVHMQSLLRANLLSAQMASGGDEAGLPVASAGEALTHFRDDTQDMVNFIDGVVDLAGGLAFTVVAAFVLGSTNLSAAVVLLFPLVGVGLATRLLDTRIKAYRSADREAAAAVTGLVGDVMTAAATIKVNDATRPVIGRLAALVERRRHTAVRDRVLEEGVNAFGQGAADIGLGLVLLVSAGALASGQFDVGQLAVFAAYLGWLSFLPQTVGRVMARRRQAEVAVDRMRRLVADQSPARVATRRSVPIRARDRAERPAPARPERVPLQRLDVEHLTVRHRDAPDGTGALDDAVHDVSFTVRRGELVVLTGPIGAGKSTLLRAVLGVDRSATVTGTIRWNGAEVADRSAFMVPPNAGYLPQVPRLLSDTVLDNIGLGPTDDDRFARAVELAMFTDELASMPDGSRTLVGPRGVRLSGGQRQRLATARAVVHTPELLVLDDLSSALDVETEVRLWDRLAAAGITVLAVSHRAVAFERADQVLHMERGRLIA